MRSSCRFYVWVLGLLLPMSLVGRQRLAGYCEQGNQTVTVSGIVSTTKVQKSYPSCTVTAYLAGTTTLAQIYSDAGGTHKGNPFTSNVDGSWNFYGDDGRYDVQFSGAGISPTFTRGDLWTLSSYVVNVRALGYGAKGDGSDDTAALQAARNAACADPSLPGVLYLPQGNYRTTQKIVMCKGLVIRGDGPKVSKLSTTSAITLVEVGTEGNYNFAQIRDITLDGARTVGSTGLYVGSTVDEAGSLQVFVDHTNIWNFDNAVHIQNSYITHFDEADIGYSLHDGIKVDPPEFLTVLQLTNTHVHFNDGRGVWISDVNVFGNVQVNISGCVIEQNQGVQLVLGKTNTVQVEETYFENRFGGPYTAAIDVSSAKNVRITGMHGSMGNVDGIIYSAGNVDRLLIENAYLISNGTNAPIKMEGDNNRFVSIRNSKFTRVPNLLGVDQVVYEGNVVSEFNPLNLLNNKKDGTFYVDGTVYGNAVSGDSASTSGFSGSGPRQNYLVWSQDFQQVDWVVTAAGSWNARTGITAPDGTATAARINLNTNAYLIQGLTFPAAAPGAPITLSGWMRVSAGQHTLATDMETYPSPGNGSGPKTTPITIDTTWRRFAVTYWMQRGNGGLSVGIANIIPSESNLVVDVWGFQVNLGGLRYYTLTGNTAINEAHDAMQVNGPVTGTSFTDGTYTAVMQGSHLNTVVPTNTQVTADTLKVGSGSSVGSNIVINGTFAADTDWNKGLGWTISGGAAHKAATAAFSLMFNLGVTPTPNKTYLCQWTQSNYATTNPLPPQGFTMGMLGDFPPSKTGNGTFSIFLNPVGAPDVIYFLGQPETSGDITNASCKEVLGGQINALGGFAVANSSGMTGTIIVKGSAGANCNVVYKGGIVISTTCP